MKKPGGQTLPALNLNEQTPLVDGLPRRFSYNNTQTEGRSEA
jgi:hypothetical protein